MVPRLLSLSLILMLAACSRSSTGPSQELMASDVGGDYVICSLVFEPGGLDPIDIRAAVMDTEASPPPRFRLSGIEHRFHMTFEVRGDTFDERSDGEYALRGRQVELMFSHGTAHTRAALPISLFLDFHENPRRLTLSDAHQSHQISRADYERLTGRSGQNVTDPVLGTLRGEFSTAGCS